MRLLIKQYLASLKERGELDAILPEILIESGMSFFSRPSIGTRQYGVDIASVGQDRDGTHKVFLFSVKAGDITRSNWDVGLQSLRTSLNEILDVYIPYRIPQQYRHLPIAICITFGGDVHEAVSDNVRSFITENTTDMVKFQEWNGDILSLFILTGILRENALPNGFRSSFRKSVAMVDEPDIAYKHYRDLVESLIDKCGDTPKLQLTVLRQLAITLWILYVWGRDADNYEALIQCSEYALLQAWALIPHDLGKRTEAKQQFIDSFEKLLDLNNTIIASFLSEKIFPFTNIMYGLTSAVPSTVALDKNLRTCLKVI